jgi:uncharacterized protein (DUF2252 family)
MTTMAPGRPERRRTRRSSHAEWAPASDRRDPVEIVERESDSRIPELVPIRYGRMLASSFTFYRGAAGIMAADLAGTPASGIDVQLCGDAHLSNFGLFAAPDQRLVFDLNDFDETHTGPWEWDVKRLAASVEIAARDLDFPKKLRARAVRATVRRYRTTMREFAAMGHLDVWYARLDVASAAETLGIAIDDDDRARLRRTVDKARHKDNVHAAAKLTEVVDGRLQFVHEPPLVERIAELLPDSEAEELEGRITALLDAYKASLPPDRRRLVDAYRFVDMARKVVGVGSVGTRAWIVLLEGLDSSDPLVLQAKEAEASALEEYTGPSEFDQHGERVVQGQRLMQATGDVLLGWLRSKGIDGKRRDFYIRQLWDGKGSANIAAMSPKRLAIYGELCGWTLARAHARSGDRRAIAGYLGSGSVFDDAMVAFSATYADQNEADFGAMRDAVASGRLTVQAG